MLIVLLVERCFIDVIDSNKFGVSGLGHDSK